LDRLESVGNTLGRGRYLAPALGVAWIGARIAGKRRAADVVARTAAAYVAGNIIVSALKPGLGRHRPDSIGDPFRFRPFSGEGEWHSLPSAHAIHAFTIAAAISSQSRRPWVPAVAYGAAGVVAWSRLYADQHWLSDVAAAGVMGTLAARGVVRWLRPHRH
ncbi:MAG TPA: phosphatase PAP2 family protein, partial [Gemmatimonadaceae bacterium]|nr:phosphatase PAP2 family protein [Gemmatimonadaceae bacterium]